MYTREYVCMLMNKKTKTRQSSTPHVGFHIQVFPNIQSYLQAVSKISC